MAGLKGRIAAPIGTGESPQGAEHVDRFVAVARGGLPTVRLQHRIRGDLR